MSSDFSLAARLAFEAEAVDTLQAVALQAVLALMEEAPGDAHPAPRREAARETLAECLPRLRRTPGRACALLVRLVGLALTQD